MQLWFASLCVRKFCILVIIFQAILVLDQLNGIICGNYIERYLMLNLIKTFLLRGIIQKDTQKMLNNGNSIIHLMLKPKGYIGMIDLQCRLNYQ